MITTARLQLLPCRAEDFQLLLREDFASLANRLAIQPDLEWLREDLVWPVLPMAADFLEQHPEAAEWWLYFFIHSATRQLIGVGGFKGAPTAGQVEVGYSIAPAWRQQGYATEATRGMVQFAFSHAAVELVLAHTLPCADYSTQVLKRTGFRFEQVIQDPEDGEIWRWCQPRKPTESA